jgi:hypothetical protein
VPLWFNLLPAGAWAHTSERAYILLLPTDRYIVGGALVVALSFVVMALVPRGGLRAVERAEWTVAPLPRERPLWPGIVSLLVFAALIAAGYVGSSDPLANPLPPVLWTGWWVGLTFLHAAFGDLWAWLNPWRAPARLLRLVVRRPLLAWPSWLGAWPAVLLLAGFAWFELVYPAPYDPARLADAALVYLGVTLAGIALFGEAAWLRHGEAFSVFFRMVAWLAPLGRSEDGRLSVALPGLRLLRVPPQPASGVAFVLLALAAVSFDGLSRTFWWVDLIGENPLEFPGRSAVMGANSLGLLATFAVFVAVYAGAVVLGRALAPAAMGRNALGRYVASIVPIAFGYHFAHYLPSFLIDIQYAAVALSDPFALGWDLFATRDLAVVASFLTHHASVEVVWNLQMAAIVLAHVVAVAVAHLLALREGAGRAAALLGLLPMTALMIAYTLFGLWLLSAPTVG